MPFLCFFMAFGHTKADYIEIVCHVSTYKNYLSYQEIVHSCRVSCSPQSINSVAKLLRIIHITKYLIYYVAKKDRLPIATALDEPAISSAEQPIMLVAAKNINIFVAHDSEFHKSYQSTYPNQIHLVQS